MADIDLDSVISAQIISDTKDKNVQEILLGKDNETICLRTWLPLNWRTRFIKYQNYRFFFFLTSINSNNPAIYLSYFRVFGI